jgi:delta 1-pyrroline-5-carboxylate dehydrogenase
MSNTTRLFSNANDAFEHWNQIEPKHRWSQLQSAKIALTTELCAGFEYQLLHASRHVGEPVSLISPTGETNELYTQGRGVAVVVIDSTADNSYSASMAIITAILIAGNSLIVCCDDTRLTKWLTHFGRELTQVTHLLQVCERRLAADLLQHDVRNLAYIGTKETAIELNIALAAKPNAITLLVAETNLVELPTALDPTLVLWFITERVRTINVTAIGGNALLLELGNNAH